MAKTKIAVIILAVAAVPAALLNAYFLRTDAGGEVLWNEKEAYFFIFSEARG